jgi:hypothetical protein
MIPQRQIWPVWAARLQQWGLGEAAALTLEAAGPLTVLGAQFLHLGRPLLSSGWTAPQLDALACLLEQPGEAQAFAEFLRKGAAA